MYSKLLPSVSILKIVKKIQLKIELLYHNKRGELRIKRKILEYILYNLISIRKLSIINPKYDNICCKIIHFYLAKSITLKPIKSNNMRAYLIIA